MSVSYRTIALPIFMLIAIGCTSSTEPKPQDAVAEAQALAKAIKGDGKQSPLCALFTQAEIELMLGTPVNPGETAALGTGCQWYGSTDEGAYLQITMMEDTRYWTPPKLGTGYEMLDGISKEAYVLPEFGGYAAGALTDKYWVAVAMNGGSTSRDATVGLLRTFLERLKKSGK